MAASLPTLCYLYTDRKTTPLVFDLTRGLSRPKFVDAALKKHRVRCLILSKTDFAHLDSGRIEKFRRELWRSLSQSTDLVLKKLFSTAYGEYESMGTAGRISALPRQRKARIGARCTVRSGAWTSCCRRLECLETSSIEKANRWRTSAIPLALILGLAGWVRLHDLGRLSLWLDEGITTLKMTFSVGELFRYTVVDNVPAPVLHHLACARFMGSFRFLRCAFRRPSLVLQRSSCSSISANFCSTSERRCWRAFSFHCRHSMFGFLRKQGPMDCIAFSTLFHFFF